METEKSDGASIIVGNVSDDCGSLLFKDRDIHELVEKRSRKKKEVPGNTAKITLYLEAGLTVRAAVNKIAEDYEQKRKKEQRNTQHTKNY